MNGNEQVVRSIYEALLAEGAGLAVGESCTGGGLAYALTGCPGISEVFAGGVVCYTEEVKVAVLVVDEFLIAEYGVVSAEVAEAMAMAVAAKFDVEHGVSTTGYAGPGGGDEQNPLGTVYIGFCSKGRCVSRKYHFEGSRDEVREGAIKAALGFIKDELK